jgi:hypothetical protein
MNPTLIPQTDSIDALARFWDEHDLTDFEAEPLEVTDPVFERGNEAPVKIRVFCIGARDAHTVSGDGSIPGATGVVARLS